MLQIAILFRPVAGIAAGILMVTRCWAASQGPPPEGNAPAPILLGMSTALTGPAALLGRDMRAGVEAALDEANREGGIRGRRLQLIALDDAYEPKRTAPNMRELLEVRKAVAVVGNVGTPTAVAAIPIAMECRAPFYGAFTGAGALRKSPPDRYIINFRASYAEETAAMVGALIEMAGLKPEEVAFFTQRDAYGDAGFVSGIAALKRHGLQHEVQVAHVRYERNTVAIENALARLITHEPSPQAVIMVGTYAPCAAFIRQARANDFNPLFLNVSFVGADALANKLGSAGDGVIVTQVVPHFSSDLPMVHEYRKALRLANPAAEFTFGSLEGYLSTRVLCRALLTISGEPTREAIVDALEGLGPFDPGMGSSLRLSKEEHQACHQIWPTVLQGGQCVDFDWRSLARRPTP